MHLSQRSRDVTAIKNRMWGAHNLLRNENDYMVEQNENCLLIPVHASE
jgi:hypothetical protein